MNLKGYVSVAIPVPVSVQNLVLRDYCQRNGHTLSLSDVEFLGGEHKMLEALIADMQHFDGICAYSMWIMPARPLDIPEGKEIHFALENLKLHQDAERVTTISAIAEAMK